YIGDPSNDTAAVRADQREGNNVLITDETRILPPLNTRPLADRCAIVADTQGEDTASKGNRELTSYNHHSVFTIQQLRLTLEYFDPDRLQQVDALPKDQQIEALFERTAPQFSIIAKRSNNSDKLYQQINIGLGDNSNLTYCISGTGPFSRLLRSLA